MASSDDLNIPLILARNIPVSTATITDEDTFIAVRGNKQTVRMPITQWVESFVTIAPSVPGGVVSDGSEGQVTWDGSGVYTYTQGAWGKSPRLATNWDDLTDDARFLLVNKIMQLSDTELANVLGTLGIGPATNTTPGLVKITADIAADNEGAVPTAAQVVDYVTDYVAEQIEAAEFRSNVGDKISSYKGNVNIQGPDGELILMYDSVHRILYVGSGVDIMRSKTDSGVEYYGSDDQLHGAVLTQQHEPMTDADEIIMSTAAHTQQSVTKPAVELPAQEQPDWGDSTEQEE